MRLLCLEDDVGFVELIRATLEAEGLPADLVRVETEPQFREALGKGGCDLILADFALPHYDGLSALRLAHEVRPETPFLFLSGYLGEDVAIEALRNGATDYVLKANLSRLAPSIRRALREAESHTQRRLSDLKLQQQAALLDLASDAIIVLDLEGLITFWNRGAETTYGWSATEAVGQVFTQLVRFESSQLSHIRKSLLDSGSWQAVLRQLNRDGVPLVVNSRWSLVRNASGAPEALFMIGTDITEQKRLEEQFLRTQRLESIGILASGIAHDLNNVLTPVSMSIQLFRDKLSDPTDLELLKNLENSTRRGADIVRQILAFARGTDGPLEAIELPRIVKEIARIISETFPRSVQLESQAPRDLWLVKGEPTQLYQVLMNLCVNARDAMPSGGRLSVLSQNRTLGPEAEHLHVNAQPGRYVVLTVADTGMGMSREVQDRMFDPFFTTKEPGKGTGLGLATTHHIVSSHGGFITVESAPQQGTRIEVYLPAYLEGVTRPDAPSATAAPAGTGELILVVDDETAICRFCLKALERAGYRCLCAGNGQEAMELFQQHRGQLRLVVTDLMMPVMGGDIAIRAMMQQEEHLRFVAMSGLLEEGVVAGLPRDRVTILAKPFDSEQLLEAVRDRLTNPGKPSAPGSG